MRRSGWLVRATVCARMCVWTRLLGLRSAGDLAGRAAGTATRRSGVSALAAGLQLALALSLGITAQGMAQGPVPQTDRVVGEVPAGARARLAGNLPEWARGRAGTVADLGAVAPETPMRVTFVLARSPKTETAFHTLLEDQQNPQSPRYHQWLTPQQIGTIYGPTAHDLAALTTWIAGQGMTVREVAPSGVFVSVEGSAAAVGAALGTSVHRFAAGQGSPRLSVASEPTVPTALAPLIRAIQGLSDVPLQPMHRLQSAPMQLKGAPGAGGAAQPRLSLATGQHFLTPDDFITEYSFFSAVHSGTTGTGESIAVVGRSRVNPTDISLFEGLTGQASTQPTVVIPPLGADPGMTADGNQAEATLDVDRALTTAPGARVDLVVSTSATGGIETAAQFEVQTLMDPILSISFSSCEVDAGQSGVTYWDTLLAQAAAEGISSFASSGDTGADGCLTHNGSASAEVRSISQICASSYVTCVGGTEFADEFTGNGNFWSDTNDTNQASLLAYVPEGAWNEPSSVGATGASSFGANATGGGASTYISKPTWQLGPGVPADGARDVPDVSFSASAHNGYVACLGFAGGDCVSTITVFSGTSAGAPSMAGIAALLDQKLGGAQGNLNPLLYRMALNVGDLQGYTSTFNDVTPATSGVGLCDGSVPSMCNNSTPGAAGLTGGLAGYPLTVGFDQATGLGSLNVGNFLTKAGQTPVLETSSISLRVNPLISEYDTPTNTFNTSQTITLEAGVGSQLGLPPTGTLQFLLNGAAFGAPVTLNGAPVDVPVSFPAAGTYVFSATYGGDSLFAASTAQPVSLTVTAAPTATSRITFAADTPTNAVGVQNELRGTVFVASASSGPVLGNVQFAANGVPFGLANPLQDGQVASTALFQLGAGTWSITAIYLGDPGHLGSTSAPETVTITKAPTTLQVVPSFSNVVTGVPEQFTAGVNFTGIVPFYATGTVEFFNNGVSFGTSPVGKSAAISPPLQSTGAGGFNVTAVYSGDANFQGSSGNSASVTVVPGAAYTLQASAPSLSVLAGTSSGKAVSVLVTQSASFAGNVTLGCAVTYQGTGSATEPPVCVLDSNFLLFPQQSGTSSAITILTVASHSVAAADTLPRFGDGRSGRGRSVGGRPGDGSMGTSGTGRSGGIALGSLLLGLLALGRRRRALRGMGALLCLLLMVGCGSGSTGSTGGGGGGGSAPVQTGGTTRGSYLITVTSTNTAGLVDPPPVTIALKVE